jgi:methionyl-tRNA formyltransferase
VKVWRARAAEGRGDPGTIDETATLATAAGGLALDDVQPEGKRRMAGSEWSKGVQLPARVDA